MSKEVTNKHEILQTGGTHEEFGTEQIGSWLEFLTDLDHLRPGLPDLTVYFGVYWASYIKVTYDRTRASLRSLTLELDDCDPSESAAIFMETHPIVREAMLSDTNPECLKNWIYNLFDHSELEELKVPFKNSKLPDRFTNLPKLRTAHFPSSNLVELPPGFYQLPVLDNLDVQFTFLKELPALVVNLPLRSLVFSPKPQLFSCLTGLIELKCFRVDYVVPDEIVQLTQLKTLYLSSVSSASVNLLKLDKLEKLSFYSARNSSFRFPSMEGSLPNLKELHINRAEVFADILSNFKSLEKLTIEGVDTTSTIQKLEESLKQLVNLKYVKLEGLGFTNLEWCSTLVNLEYLGIGKNGIETIPLGLGNLQKLKTIELNNNPILTFPELPTMASVTWINLQDTKIPDDEDAPAIGIPIPEERNRLKRIFPNVEYLSLM